MKALIVYWSKTGNTEKVSFALKDGLEEAGAAVDLKTVEEAKDVNYFAYDLVCIGFPAHQWHPPTPVGLFLKDKFSEYLRKGYVKTAAPQIAGKYALIFCTYAGSHTGIREAIPAGKYAGQFFEHLGFAVLDEWYILGEHHGSVERSTKGRMGNIQGRPHVEDLKKVKRDAAALTAKIINSLS